MVAPPRDSSHDEVLRSRTGSQCPLLMWEPLPAPLPCPDTHSQGPVLGRPVAVRRGWGERGSADKAPEGSPLAGRGPGDSPLGGRCPGGSPLGGRAPEGNHLGGKGWGPGDTLAGHRGMAGTGPVGKGPLGRVPWRAGALRDIQGWGEDSCPQTPRNSFHGTWPQLLWSPPRGQRENS